MYKLKTKLVINILLRYSKINVFVTVWWHFTRMKVVIFFKQIQTLHEIKIYAIYPGIL